MDQFTFDASQDIETQGCQLALQHLLKLATELASERNTDRLLENILLSAMELSDCEGGTIYSISENNELAFSTLINRPLDLHMGGTSGEPILFPPIPIYLDNNKPNSSALVALAAASGESICIEDVYSCTEYDLSAARAMDAKTGYHTQAVLTIPLANHENELNGVVQLINPREHGKVKPFSAQQVAMVKSIGALAAVALTNRQLIDSMEELFQAFSRLIAKAIDEKSPYTGGHCRRVPELTMMIAEAVHNHSSGPFAQFEMTEADRHELTVAGWLHDCGKIAIPEYVMDKATKLHSVYDRIELVVAKIEIAKRDVEIKSLKKINALIQQDELEAVKTCQAELEAELNALDEQIHYLKRTNIGGEFMSDKDQQKVKDLAEQYHITIDAQTQPLLSQEEVYNLSIPRGTLTPEERTVINRHMNITIEMLEALPFPKHLRRVPEFAGGHHEKMDGTGYPKGLKRDEMSVPARIMAIADIYEALTAADRPYKDAKPLSECLTIMGKMKLGDHIDPDLFDIFVESGVYLDYANAYLKAEQIDSISLDEIPGYSKE